MTITENKQLMYRFTNFINTASKELAEELIAPDAVFYVPMQKSNEWSKWLSLHNSYDEIWFFRYTMDC